MRHKFHTVIKEKEIRIKIHTDTIGDMLQCSISPNKIRTNTIGDMLLCSISPNKQH